MIKQDFEILHFVKGLTRFDFFQKQALLVHLKCDLTYEKLVYREFEQGQRSEKDWVLEEEWIIQFSRNVLYMLGSAGGKPGKVILL